MAETSRKTAGDDSYNAASISLVLNSNGNISPIQHLGVFPAAHMINIGIRQCLTQNPLHPSRQTYSTVPAVLAVLAVVVGVIGQQGRV